MSSNLKFSRQRPDIRHGAIMPMFAVILPVMMVICFIAMNLAYMQLSDTELKIATDAAARAGGRAWSDTQDLDSSREFARRAAELNMVSGRALELSTSEADGQIMFGNSIRPDDVSRYNFTELPDSDIQDGAGASGIRVFANQPTNLLFKVAGITSFTPKAASIATQVDRDMALVIDRSGSMMFYKDTDEMYDEIVSHYRRRRIGYQEAVNAVNYISFSDNVVQRLQGEMREFAESFNADYATGNDAPLHSRWKILEAGIEVFFQTLEATDQTEQVSISSFATGSRIDHVLTKNMSVAEQTVKDLFPTGATAVGDGVLSAIQTLLAEEARPFAVKSIVVFTDGISNNGTDPVLAAQQVVADNPNVIIHAITFSPGADQQSMADMAAAANGKHYHANTGDELVDVFEEIAASLPTIVTD